MARYGDLDSVKLKVQRYLIPNTDIDGTVDGAIAERWFLKLLDEEPTADVVSMGEFEELRATLDATIAGQVTLQEALAKANGDIKGIFSEMENAMRLGLIASRSRFEVKGGRSMYKTALLAGYNTFACVERFVAELKKKYLEVENDS